nr:RNA methyltransferase [Tissierella sp.]
MLEITSSKNAVIKEIKSLSRRKNRWREKLFIIEGIKIIEEALVSSVSIKHIFFSDALFEAEGGEDLFGRIKLLQSTIKLSRAVFNDITDIENPQGVLAIAEFKERKMEDVFEIDNPSIIFLDGLNDPGNLGTIIRTADAFNIDAIVLGENSVDPYNSKVVRSTMGSIFRVPLYNCKNNDLFFKYIIENKINIITTSLSGDTLEKEIFKDSFVAVIGNEANGVSQEILANSTKLVKIPMPGLAESLNAGVAASIIMYEAMRSRE